jgi:UDP-glucose 4-epimerase
LTAVVVGNGFIGSVVARALADAGRSVTVVGRQDRDRLVYLVGPGTDVVFAAGPSVPAAVEVDASAGVEALRLLETVIELVGAVDGTLLFVSSGAVYGESDRLPVDEGHPLRPVNVYGTAMAAAEALVSEAVRRHGLAATALRCGNVYGPGQDPTRRQGLIAELLDAVAVDRPVEIWGDGSIERDYLHIDDFAEVVLACAGRRDLPPALNVGSGRATSVSELLDLVETVTGKAVDVRRRPGRSFDVGRIALDIGRLRGLTGFEPLPLETGIARTWALLERRSPV